MNPDIPATIDLYNLRQTQLPDTIFTSADNFGGQSQGWQGFDVTVDGRLENLLIQGGLSTGRHQHGQLRPPRHRRAGVAVQRAAFHRAPYARKPTATPTTRG